MGRSVLRCRADILGTTGHAEGQERVKRQAIQLGGTGWAGWRWGGVGFGGMMTHVVLDALPAAMQRERNGWKDKLRTTLWVGGTEWAGQGGDGVGMGCGGMLTHVCWTRCLRPRRESGTDGKTNYTPVDVMGWV